MYFAWTILQITSAGFILYRFNIEDSVLHGVLCVGSGMQLNCCIEYRNNMKIEGICLKTF